MWWHWLSYAKSLPTPPNAPGAGAAAEGPWGGGPRLPIFPHLSAHFLVSLSFPNHSFKWQQRVPPGIARRNWGNIEGLAPTGNQKWDWGGWPRGQGGRGLFKQYHDIYHRIYNQYIYIYILEIVLRMNKYTYITTCPHISSNIKYNARKCWRKMSRSSAS